MKFQNKIKMIFFFLFLLKIYSKEIYSKVNGFDNSFCHALAPCSFEKAAEQINPQDFIFIQGSKIEKTEDLEKARVLFNIALGKGAIVTSDNLTIDGTNYKPVGLSFIVVQSAEECRIHKFTFIGFNTPILCFRHIEKGVISSCTFMHNHVVGNIAMLMFGVGKCKFDECYIAENTVTNTTLIAMFSTHLYLNMTNIERNYVDHDSSQSLLYAINSVCEYTNTTIRNNASPFAPLHQFEFRSCFGFWNCTWENNHHHELLLCDGTCEFNFTNNTIRNNQGTFLSTSTGAVVTFNESWFYNNFSGDKAMFDIPGSEFNVYAPAVFRDNAGKSFIDTRGAKSNLKIDYAQFLGNRFDEAVLAADSNSSVRLSQCEFKDNLAAQGTLHVNQSNVRIDHSLFQKNHGISINLTDCNSNIELNQFSYSVGDEGASITSNGGLTRVLSNFFKGQVIGGHLKLDGKRSLFGNSFSSSDNLAISGKLHSECYMCKYGAKQDVIYSWKQIISPYVIIAVIIIFALFLFEDQIRSYARLFFSKKDL